MEVMEKEAILERVKAIISKLTASDVADLLNNLSVTNGTSENSQVLTGHLNKPAATVSRQLSTSRTSKPASARIVHLPEVVSATSRKRATLSPCPETSPHLVGVRASNSTSLNLEALEKKYTFLESGGDYGPPECRARERTAILIPYRNRWTHLLTLLNNLIPFLVRQQLSFTVFVIEQEPPATFNRALLLNIGVLEAVKRDMYTCFVFHDVDLIPLDDHNLYRCGDQPRHLAVGINKFGYRLPYRNYFGGVSAMSREQLEKTNGNSNLYFGWGGEDDDLFLRAKRKGMTVARYPGQIGRYDMFKHVRDSGNTPNPNNGALLGSTVKRMDVDGLNSVRYNVTSVQVLPVYTWINVTVDPFAIIKNSPSYLHRLFTNFIQTEQKSWNKKG